MSRSARRAVEALAALGHRARVREFPEGTRTAAEAAAAIGCEVGQIAKSVVLRRPRSGGRPLLVVASGAHRVDLDRVGGLVGGPVEPADAAGVREATGYAIGGVPPVGHPERIETIVDEALLSYDEVWAAAGNPRAVFPISPTELVALCGGRVEAVGQSR